ncbi:hypothetical protein U9M48_029440 [Paspalum notatum var. saurae]|uniref:Uncharacterized protein n=1 Tax=Paspalum notatum var. saurae TaxID=547442 RepID=A0AAQ3U3C8_PASNO
MASSVLTSSSRPLHSSAPATRSEPTGDPPGPQYSLPPATLFTPPPRPPPGRSQWEIHQGLHRLYRGASSAWATGPPDLSPDGVEIPPSAAVRLHQHRQMLPLLCPLPSGPLSAIVASHRLLHLGDFLAFRVCLVNSLDTWMLLCMHI